MSSTSVIHGDMRVVLLEKPADFYDSVVCDPPYDLTSVSRGGSPRQFVDNPYGRTRVGSDRGGFMGRTWDGTGIAFDPQTWREVYRVLKPGGYLIAFGGTRTHHRMMCAIEDAGFEIRDTLSWLYGQGFPKSLDVSKQIDKAAGVDRDVIGFDATRARPNRMYEAGALGNIGGTGHISDRTDNGATKTAPATIEAKEWDGWGTSLKPAWEPIILARKPLSEPNVAANVLKHGTGAINIDTCRINGGSRPLRELDPKPEANGAVYAGRQEVGHGFDGGSKAIGETTQGRWPANVILSHSASCVVVGQQPVRGDNRGDPGGTREGGFFNIGSESGNKQPNSRVYGDTTVEAWQCVPDCPVRLLDEQSGLTGASAPVRGTEPSSLIDIVYSNRARVPGTFYGDSAGASRFFYTSKTSTSERQERSKAAGIKNDHETVKPLDLMRWLVRLVTRPGGHVLDPFAGSGSTLVAAIMEGMDATGIEREPKYVKICQARIDGVQVGGLL